MISLTVNGKKREIEGPIGLLAYVESLGVNMNLIAVGHNGEVVRKEALAGVTLADGDRVEIVRAVGGG